jgi:hypothetical protein
MTEITTRADASPPLSISRPTEVARLTELILNPKPGLNVGAVSGPGGVGKSFLLAHVLETVDLAAAGYVHLSVDASNSQTRGDFFGILEQLFQRSIGEPADPRKDYFPHLRDVAAIHRRLTEQAATELTRQGAPESLKRNVAAILKAGHVLNKTMPKGREYLDVAARNLPLWGAVVAAAVGATLNASQKVSEEQVRAALDEAWGMVGDLKSLKDSTALPGPLRDLLGVTLRNRIRRELFHVTAEELVTDLSAAIGGYQAKDRRKLTQGGIPNAKRLLLVLDDYELLNPLLGDFLIGALLPELAKAQFETVMVILCRDDLESTHVGWAQHCRKYIRDQIRLSAFDQPTALELLKVAGVSEERRKPLFEATQGYPFLLSLVIEEAAHEANSALFLRRFYDRTTRWMSPREQEWFERVCYLERVNEDTLARLFPGEDVREIQNWFEREPSIRDPSASFFRVRPLIREKVLRYLELRAPSRHKDRTQLAAES